MSVIEVLQNCVIFNDKTHAAFRRRQGHARRTHDHAAPRREDALRGQHARRVSCFEDMKLKVVTVGQDGYTLDDVLTHDAHERDTTLHSMLAAMKYPDIPGCPGRDPRRRGRHGLRPRGGPAGREGQGTRARSARWTSCCIRAPRGKSNNLTGTTLIREASRHTGKPALEAPAFSLGGTNKRHPGGRIARRPPVCPRLPVRKPPGQRRCLRKCGNSLIIRMADKKTIPDAPPSPPSERQQW